MQKFMVRCHNLKKITGNVMKLGKKTVVLNGMRQNMIKNDKF